MDLGFLSDNKFLIKGFDKQIKSSGKTIINGICIKFQNWIKQFFCGLAPYYAVQCTRYLR